MATVSYRIKGSAETTPIQEVKKGLNDLNSTTDKVAKGLKALAGGFVVDKIISGISSCVNEFTQMERTNIRLKRAIDANGLSFDKMNNLMEEQSLIYSGVNDDIDKLVTEMAQLGMTDSEIEKLTKASVTLAEVTGKDLNSSFTLLQGTLSGSAGKLEKLLPEMGGLTKEQLASGQAIELVNSKLGKYNELMTETASSKMSAFNKSFGDLRELIGEQSFSIFSPLIDGLTAYMKGITDAYAEQKRVIDLLKKETELTPQEQLFIAESKLKKLTEERATYGNINQATLGARAGKSYVGENSPVILKLDKEIAALSQSIGYLNQYIKANPVQEKRADFSNNTISVKPIEDRKRNFGKVLDGFTSNFKQFGKDLGTGFLETASKGKGLIKDVAKLSETYIVKEEPFLNSAYDNLPTDYIGIGEQIDAETPFKWLTDGVNDFVFSMQVQATSFGDSINQLAINPLLGLSNATLNLVDTIGSLLGQFGEAMGSIASIKALMDPLQIVLDAFIKVIEGPVNDALKPFIGLLVTIGESLGKAMIPLLKVMAPVISALVDAFIFLYNKAIRPLANFIIDIIGFVWNVVADIVNGILGFLDSIFHNINFRMNKVDANSMHLEEINRDQVDKNGNAWMADNANKEKKEGGTQYTAQAVRDIIVNISFANSYVNGDAQEIAIALRNEIRLAEATGR